ncbi:MAG: hypothetical protein AMXMBFR4_27580 [Candidatus Hydrogenedentota bacterium]
MVGPACIALIIIAAGAESPPTERDYGVTMIAVSASIEHQRSPALADNPKPSPTATDPYGSRSGFVPGANKPPKAQGAPRATKHFDDGLESIRAAVADLPYDTYRKVRSESVRTKMNQETSIAINERYTLLVTPLSTDTGGRVRVRARILEQTDRNGEPVTIKALDTTSAVVPGKHLMLGGLSLGDAQLIVFVTITM